MNFYQAIVENQTDLICRFNETGILTYVNKAYCNYFGKPRDELLKKSFIPLVLEEDRAVIESSFASISPDNPTVVIQCRVLLNGEVRWQEWTDTFLYDAKGNFLEGLAVGRDITKRKTLELEVQATSQTLSSFFSLAPIMMGILNMEGQVLRVNPPFEQTLGYSLAELNATAQTPLLLFAADDLAMLDALWEELTVNGKTHLAEVPTLTKAGVQRLINWRFSADLEEGLVFCIGEDVTETRRLASAKITNDAQFSAIVDNMPGGVVYTNAQLEITLVNASFLRSFGYSELDVLQKTPEFLFHSQADYASTIDKTKLLRSNPTLLLSSEVRTCVRKNGETFQADTLIRSLTDPNGMVIGFLYFMIDVSIINEELKSLNQTLEQRVEDRTQEIQALVSKLTHDFKSPIRSIGNFAMFLEQDYGAVIGEQGLQFLDAIKRNAGYMNKLVIDLLELSKVRYTTDYYFEPIQLQSFIHTIANRSDANQLGTITIGENLPTVSADPNLLEQAISNLLDNAAKYIPEHVTPDIKIDVIETASHWGIQVADNGIGIAVENQKRIFVMFERVTGLKKRYEGTGVGLAIVKSVAEIHHGYVTLDSTVGAGSVFTLFISKDG